MLLSESTGSGGVKWVAIGAAAVLALGAGGGLLASTVVASSAYQKRYERSERKEQTLSVTGSARKRIVSDLAVWRITVNARGKQLPAAYVSLTTATERVAAFLKERHFTANEVGIGAIDTDAFHARDEHGNETPLVEQYTLRRAYTITSRNLDAVTDAASSITELIRDGLEVVSGTPEFHYTQLGDLKVLMIGEAAKDARARGEQIAMNAACRITGVRNARMGVMQITRPNSTEVSDYGVNDTSSIEKDVTAVVALTMSLENLGE
jgi:uncharacterized protein